MPNAFGTYGLGLGLGLGVHLGFIIIIIHLKHLGDRTLGAHIHHVLGLEGRWGGQLGFNSKLAQQTLDGLVKV